MTKWKNKETMKKGVEKDNRLEINVSKDSETNNACERCHSAVKFLVDCDLCGNWSCKICMGVNAVRK